MERGRSSVRRWEYTSPRGRRGDSTPRARKRDRSESQEIFEPRRPRRHDDTTTPLSKTLGVGREDTVILPTHKWLPVQSWLETSGTPHDQVVRFLSEDPTRTHGVLAEIEKWRGFVRGLQDNPVDLAVLLNEGGRRRTTADGGLVEEVFRNDAGVYMTEIGY